MMANPNEVMEDWRATLDKLEREIKEADTALFVSNDGHVTLAAFFLLMGGLFLSGGRWFLGITCVLIGALVALCNAMDQIAEEDKLEIRYGNMPAEDIINDLIDLENALDFSIKDEKRRDALFKRSRLKFLTALKALAKRIARAKNRKSLYHPHEIECIGQDAAYSTFRLFPNDDELIASALSLHALVAKDSEVRQRHLCQADEYGLNVPIEAMKQAMSRAQSIENPPENLERGFVELQRKACLLLGALADGDKDVATKIVDEQGLQAILEVLIWYRYHDDGANWALWATFILCYDHPGNKQELIRLDGIKVICQTILNIPYSPDVARHGVATLFDLLREDSENPTCATQIRKMAVHAGLHNALRSTMDEFSQCMQVMMMSQEMLVVTGFKGEIPIYEPIR